MLLQIEYFDNDILTNLISILAVKPDKVAFVYDKEVFSERLIEDVYLTCKKYIKNLDYETYTVDSDNLEEVYELTKRLIPKNDDCIIDLTGGNDLLTIAGYKAGKAGIVLLIYADIRKGCIINVETNELLCKTPNISLEDYLSAKGAGIIRKSDFVPDLREEAKYESMCRYIFEHLSQWKPTCRYLQQAMAASESLVLSHTKKIISNNTIVSPDENLLRRFLELGLIKNLVIKEDKVEFEFSSEASKHYMTVYGSWLELYVYINVRKLDQTEGLRMGAIIDWNSKDGIDKAGNEIDIIFSRNSRPVSISCKLTEPDIAAVNEILINTRRIGGTKGKGILVAFSNMKRVNSNVFQRAKELGIYVLDREDILSSNFSQRLMRAIDDYKRFL